MWCEKLTMWCEKLTMWCEILWWNLIYHPMEEFDRAFSNQSYSFFNVNTLLYSPVLEYFWKNSTPSVSSTLFIFANNTFQKGTTSKQNCYHKAMRQIKELFLAKKVNLESLENIMQGRPKFKSDETSPSPDLKHFKTKLQMFHNTILLWAPILNFLGKTSIPIPHIIPTPLQLRKIESMKKNETKK